MGAGQVAAPFFGHRLETKVGSVLPGFKVYPREGIEIQGISRAICPSYSLQPV
jgi:hypothetical protein